MPKSGGIMGNSRNKRPKSNILSGMDFLISYYLLNT